MSIWRWWSVIDRPLHSSCRAWARLRSARLGAVPGLMIAVWPTQPRLGSTAATGGRPLPEPSLKNIPNLIGQAFLRFTLLKSERKLRAFSSIAETLSGYLFE